MARLYVTVCKQLVQRRSPRPVRISRGKHGKPLHKRKATFRDVKKVTICYEPKNPLPWGARAWIEIEE